MENPERPKKKRLSPWILGAIVLLLFVFLILLQTSNLWKNLSVETTSDTLLLYALSSFNFIALIVFGFIFFRSIVKLARERRALKLGSKIKTRLLFYFFLVSLLPIIAMAVFSYLFMNRALERWFTQIPENVVRQAREVQGHSLSDRTTKLDEAAQMLASSFGTRKLTNDDLARVAVAGNLSYIEIVAGDGHTIDSYEREVPPAQRDELSKVVDSIHAGQTEDANFRDGRGFDVAMAEMPGGRTLVIIPDPFGEQTVSQIVDSSLREFDELKEKQVTVRQVGLLTLGVLTFVLMFASSWIAFYVARGITIPIQALAGGAKEVAGGHLGYQVNALAEDELELLVAAFNEMSATLASNSTELTERKKYIETILASLPTGVVAFDSENRVTSINPAASAILNETDPDVTQVSGESLFDADNALIVTRLLNRARRVGRAAEQITLSGPGAGREIMAVLSATALPSGGGVVLVIEDLSELISAQRAAAWQEVARRMAHEIKNPLTPIQLSAERIAKRFSSEHTSENPDRPSIGDVVKQSTETIIREVSSLKSMVDEFSRFARLPDVKLTVGSVNEAILQAVNSYEGRHSDIVLDVRLSENLPEIPIDDEQLARVFVNLIENAVEAFPEDRKEKRIDVRTRFDAARDLIVAEVADNGNGISAGDLPKIFQPYFSTKGRGTGLGLAIVRRIIVEHKGRIFATANAGGGAKFTIELPGS
ncbi:MAG: HAMP domain-containing protein [Pyrinomonadaceae bacterium]|nr:HAMP domain-containing protein [Pyrinomonadaceae bacterium]